MTYWLLREGVYTAMRDAREANYTASDAEMLLFSRSQKEDEVLEVEDDVGIINIRGVLTPQPDIIAYLFGGGNTIYGDIIAAADVAENSEEVERIRLQVSSPGGAVDGFFKAMDALASVTKPIEAVVEGQATSAAFGLASQADTILAEDRATEVGSVGVAVSMFADPEIVTITSSEAPDKRPDVTTEEGRQVVQEQLDDVHQLFAEGIAEGRGVTVKEVNSDFGRGRVFLANEAKERGMIDGIIGAPPERRPRSTAQKPTSARPEPMNKDQLLAQYPEACEALIQEERARVEGHLEGGELSGNMAKAIENVKSGAALDNRAMMAYMREAGNRNLIEAREEDDNASEASQPQDAPDSPTSMDDVVAAAYTDAYTMAGLPQNAQEMIQNANSN